MADTTPDIHPPKVLPFGENTLAKKLEDISSSVPFAVTRVCGAEASSFDDLLAVEEPLEIRLGVYNRAQRIYKSVSVTMRTPGHDEDLAAGFLFTEGIVRERGQIENIESWGPRSGEGDWRNIVKVDLARGVEVDMRRLERHFYTTSSCGICGKASLDAVRSAACRAHIASDIRVSAATLHSLPSHLRSVQRTFDATGGLHAAALFTGEGELRGVREDVGRHNAVDKLIGDAWLRSSALDEAVMIVSGRAGFELVQKSVAAGIPIMAAVGAPTTLAVELAAEFGLTLIGFLRDGRFNIYCGEQRICGLETA